jgi:hypothetical protein
LNRRNYEKRAALDRRKRSLKLNREGIPPQANTPLEKFPARLPRRKNTDARGNNSETNFVRDTNALDESVLVLTAVIIAPRKTFARRRSRRFRFQKNFSRPRSRAADNHAPG